jgi:hypothetical protein
MGENCVPYRRKGLYLALTLPMMALYVVVAAYLWTVGVVFAVLYIAFFVLVAAAQAYVCVYWQCPYVGRFAPCVGGFCLPSSQIAKLYRNVKRSEGTYNLALTLAFVSFSAIILFPVYFLYQLGLLYLLAYLGIVVAYALCFLLFICPVCATRHVCPGGQTAVRLRELMGQH